jgi:CBS domain-containing protein
VVSTTPTLEAIEIMRCAKIGCLPVVDDGQLVGIVTSYDFLTATARLFKQHLERSGTPIQDKAKAQVAPKARRAGIQ